MKRELLTFVVWMITLIVGVTSGNAQESETPLFVREDCVWEYEYYSHPSLMEKGYKELYQYKFDGATVIENIPYYKLKKIKTITWYISGEDINKAEEKDDDEIIALVREENGKVWMRNTFTDPILKDNGMDWDTESAKDLKEILLFNFNINIGVVESYWGRWPMYNKFAITDFKIINVAEEDGREIITSRYCYENPKSENIFTYAKGVGSIENGTILGPFIIVDYKTDGSWYESTFNNQYDLDGNVIFAGKGTKVPDLSGIHEMSIGEKASGRKYDVMGREINHPQPGSIYIQDGRKYIAR